MYEDDGKTPLSIENSQYELLDFYYLHENGEQKFEFRRSGAGYVGKPLSRELTLVVHNQQAAPQQIYLDGRYIQLVPQLARFNRMQNVAYYDRASRQLKVKINWQMDKQQLLVR
jgi:oligosaccharide 4-alpha-D-glucosyltransferase